MLTKFLCCFFRFAPDDDILSHALLERHVGLVASSGSDRRKLVYKKYRDTKEVRNGLAKDGRQVQVYFADVFMQHQAAIRANAWNKQAPSSCPMVAYAPAFVMRVPAAYARDAAGRYAGGPHSVAARPAGYAV